MQVGIRSHPQPGTLLFKEFLNVFKAGVLYAGKDFAINILLLFIWNSSPQSEG